MYHHLWEMNSAFSVTIYTELNALVVSYNIYEHAYAPQERGNAIQRNLPLPFSPSPSHPATIFACWGMNQLFHINRLVPFRMLFIILG